MLAHSLLRAVPLSLSRSCPYAPFKSLQASCSPRHRDGHPCCDMGTLMSEMHQIQPWLQLMQSESALKSPGNKLDGQGRSIACTPSAVCTEERLRDIKQEMEDKLHALTQEQAAQNKVLMQHQAEQTKMLMSHAFTAPPWPRGLVDIALRGVGRRRALRSHRRGSFVSRQESQDAAIPKSISRAHIPTPCNLLCRSCRVAQC